MLLKGNCIEVMKAIKPNSVDAICTDPPYGLEFMGKEWDKLWGENSLGNKPSHSKSPQYLDKWTNQKCLKCGHWINSGTPCKCKEPILEQRPIKNDQFRKMQLWHTQWLIEAYRVLKPGGSMLVMGGTRTSHRLACAIEDSGFIIKDTLMWLYGSGFPKAQDLGKMIDKRMGKEREVVAERIRRGDKKAYPKNPTRPEKEYQGLACGGGMGLITKPAIDLAKYWDGFKVGTVKPAYEPIIWAVKPPEGSYVDNVLKWGVGAVNVDECRIGYENTQNPATNPKYRIEKGYKIKHTMGGCFGNNSPAEDKLTKGRFPANIILSHHPECVQVGMKRVKGLGGSGRASEKGHGFQTKYVAGNKKSEGFAGGFVDKDGLEQVESWDCHPDCAVRLLDEQSGNLPNNYRKNKGIGKNNCAYFGNAKSERGGIPYNDNGGASRFFYCAKASRAERNAGLDSLAIIDIIRVWKESNIIREEKLAKLQVDMVTLHARAIDGFGIKNKSVLEWSMSWFGKNTLEKYQKDIGFTIKTTINSITISQILKYLTSLLIKEYTADVKLLKGNGGNPAENADDSNQLIISISESMASRLGVKDVTSRTQLKISVKEGRNIHPTCKPTKLFEYLIKLVTRQGQIILDPFIGSGTTAIATHNTGRKCIGIEKEEEYIEIAKRRATHWRSRPKQLEMTGG